MRREPAPGYFTSETKVVEIFGVVARHPRGQNLLLPRRRGEFASLHLAHDLQRAVDAMQLRARIEVLPAPEERVEFRRGDGLDLAAQPPDGEPMDARQQSAVAPFELTRAGRELP